MEKKFKGDNPKLALSEARGLVREVCRCGHLASEHVSRNPGGDDYGECLTMDGECACEKFQSARVKVVEA